MPSRMGLCGEIGLTVAREMASPHGGKVEARGDGPGQGSEFVVTLPRS